VNRPTETGSLHTEVYKLLGGIESWEQAGAYARIAFYRCMKGKLYGFDPLLDAWHWFYSGWKAQQSPEPCEKLTADTVEWVVNDNAELGVKIGDQFFFLYKGRSLVYEEGKHDDGRPMRWRPVFKREFGECCHPVNYADLRKCGHQHLIGTVDAGDSDEWQDLPPCLALTKPGDSRD
jgi:hypothetical protein